jgi:hypothetical protein
VLGDGEDAFPVPVDPALKRAALVLTLAASLGAPSLAQERERPPLQRGGTFVEPPPRVDPVYLPAAPDVPGTPAPTGPDWVSLRLSFDVPLRSVNSGDTSGQGVQGSPPASPTGQLSMRFTPFEDKAWFLQTTLLRYLRSERQRPWNPDFTYAFGYEDWRPGTWSFTYANYSGNRFSPDEGESRFNFSRGQWSVGHKFALPEAIEPIFLVGDGDQVGCAANANLTPRYTDLRLRGLQSNKTSLSLGCRYSRPEGWFVQFTGFAWPDRDRQQPWDPDYTYSLGWFDWRPGSWSVYYSNYSGNRWPGRERARDQGRLRNGSITLSWSVPL